MRKLYILMLLLCICTVPARAEAFVAPEVLDSGKELMPKAESFEEGLLQIIQRMLPRIRPDLYEAGKVAIAVIGAVMLSSVLHPFSEQIKAVTELAGTAAVSATLLLSANSMIRLGAETIDELTEYGKLLLPVLTASYAAQGRAGTSAALYAGTAFFSTLLGNLISKVLLPIVYLFLALGVAHSATGEEMIKKLRDIIKEVFTWSLKALLTLFMTYMGITGAISGTADAAALKATKTVISTAVPVVGGILSEASEAVLVSVGLAKNAAGIYGILAVLAIFLGPFIKIGSHYLILKGTGMVCSVFSVKRLSELIGDFSSAMGFLLAMTGSVCLLILISTACFLQGAV